MADKEAETQRRTIEWLTNKQTGLGYNYIGKLDNVYNESVKKKLLEAHLKKQGYDKKQISHALKELTERVSNEDDALYKANQEVYSLLRYGCQSVEDENKNITTVKYIDWQNANNNDFSVAEQVSIKGVKNDKRPDLVIYVNGIALSIIELKRSTVEVGEGVSQLLRNQQEPNIREFFNTAQLLVAGNESQGILYGTIKTSKKYYAKWKEYKDAKDATSIKVKAMLDNCNPLKTGLFSLYMKERFLSLIYNFVIFDAGVKKIARHNQFFAVKCCIEKINKGEGGIVWNTQGTGKSLIMVWLARWIRENIDDARVVVVTDREELDDQIESVFLNSGEKIVRAKSCEDLRELLNKHENNLISSLIHKYGHNAGSDSDIEKYVKELLANLPSNYEAKGKIVAFIDECHRTNSGKLHEAMKQLMPNATLIGFTGTPLLKKDKKPSIETFGPYIHTYKVREAVDDGVILDLLYEARDIDQELRSKDKIDKFFNSKTAQLTESAKQRLKQRWATLRKLYSSKDRLERIVGDIIYDMNMKPRLQSGRGTALLVAGSIYEACRYWKIFNEKGFKKCAVISSFEPKEANVSTATIDPDSPSEAEEKNNIYKEMLCGKTQAEYEKEKKTEFKKEPWKCQLLIVVDKLLAGFDAPSATYLYIDKSMRDHKLFQAVCRVNRPDDEDKNYGYIVDYKDLFRDLENAFRDYNAPGAFDAYDEEDVKDLLKKRFEEAKAAMQNALNDLEDMLAGVPLPKNESEYRNFFCDDKKLSSEDLSARRNKMYKLVSCLTRSFAECCEKLSDYGYTENEIDDLRNKIKFYIELKKMIKLSSGDSADFSAYDNDMRWILDNYISASDPQRIGTLDNKPLVELLTDPDISSLLNVFNSVPGKNPEARAEVIESNLKQKIIKKYSDSPVMYDKLSEMLNEAISQRRRNAKDYEAYLILINELAKVVEEGHKSNEYPDAVKDSRAKCEFYDYFCVKSKLENAKTEAEKLSCKVDENIRSATEPDWKQNIQKTQGVKESIYKAVIPFAYDDKQLAKEETEEVFKIAQNQDEYDEI